MVFRDLALSQVLLAHRVSFIDGSLEYVLAHTG